MLIKVPPMTAAERQRKCRAGGKGRHRGGIKNRKTQARRRVQEAFAAARAASAPQAAATASFTPEAAPAPQPPSQLNLSSLAA